MSAASAAAVLYDESDRLEAIPRRLFRDKQDPFALNDLNFMQYFRLDKELVMLVTDEIKTFLPSEGLPPHARVLAALRFYATGSYQQVVGNDMFLGFSQKTVSRCIDAVSHAISTIMMSQHVQFPGAEEQLEIKRRFFSKCGFPGIVGCIDCTHIAVIQPAENSTTRPLSYLNRKGFYSINVQLICDDTLIIRAVSARYPGSVHDSFIWHHSAIRSYIKRQYDRGNKNAWLLGDSGYPLEPWLMTPFSEPLNSQAEEAYNFRHASSRNAIERCNGVLKARFRCLLKHRVLHYTPTKASKIINSCVVLHNLCVKKNLPLEHEAADTGALDDDVGPNSGLPTYTATGPYRSTGQQLREQIAQSF